jgi:hypothetical protein
MRLPGVTLTVLNGAGSDVGQSAISSTPIPVDKSRPVQSPQRFQAEATTPNDQVPQMHANWDHHPGTWQNENQSQAKPATER